MKIDDVLLLRIASHSREHVTKCRFVTSHSQQHRIFRAVTPRAKCTKRCDPRAHDATEVDSLVEQLCFNHRLPPPDRLVEFQVSFRVLAYEAVVRSLLNLPA